MACKNTAHQLSSLTEQDVFRVLFRIADAIANLRLGCSLVFRFYEYGAFHIYMSFSI